MEYEIAALFVEIFGAYFDAPEVDTWCIIRDARNYKGPHPVVAHPPCERWGSYWNGGPSARVKRILGDDGGCFKSALSSVREFGGVIEHPRGSHAFYHFFLPIPKESGGWFGPDCWGGYSCCVAQGHYGHLAQKMTWLYVVGLPREHLPKLKWGKCEGKMRLDEGYKTSEERRVARAAGIKPMKRLTPKQNRETPPPFRDALIKIVVRIKALRKSIGKTKSKNAK